MFSVASFFAGVGGIDLGFEETGEFKTVYANEFDSYASETFEMNYPTVKVDQRDIHLVPVEDSSQNRCYYWWFSLSGIFHCRI